MGINIKHVIAFIKKHQHLTEHTIDFDEATLTYTTKVWIAGELFSETILDCTPLANAIIKRSKGKRA